MTGFGFTILLSSLILNMGYVMRKIAERHFAKKPFTIFAAHSIIEDNGKAINSPDYRYRITNEFHAILLKFGKDNWNVLVDEFIKNHSSLIEMYVSKKNEKNAGANQRKRVFVFYRKT